MRQSFKLHVTAPAGPVLVGGYSPSIKGGGEAGASMADQRPMIPSTAIRGALRETLERIVRALPDQNACDGGSGDKIKDLRSTGEEDSNRDFTGCTLGADGQRCIACQIFGTASTRGGAQATEGLLVVGDLVAPEPFTPTIRHNVAVGRRTRSAENALLRAVIVHHTPNIEYQGDLIFRGGEVELKYLKAAMAGTTHLGQGRSRGFGRVDVFLGEPGALISNPQKVPEKGDLKILLRLRSPTLLGETLPGHAFLDTRFELPGSAIRGMLGFSIADSLDSPNENKVFQGLVADGSEYPPGAIFDFFYPVDSTDDSAEARPWPTTFRRCRTHKDEIRDTLFDRLKLHNGESIDDWRCKKCDRLLKRIKMGGQRKDDKPKTLTVTRTSMDRRHGSVRNNALFSQRLLSAESLFEGSIRRIPVGGHALLQQGLAQPLTIGRGAARGWGQLEILSCEALPTSKPIKERAKAYAKQFSDPQGLVVVTLLSPTLFEGDESDLLDLIGEHDVVLCARYFGIERGWSKDPRKGKKRGCLESIRSVKAGGVYVLRLKSPIDFQNLANLEVNGLGKRTYQGFGRVRFFDPIHLDPTFQFQIGGTDE